MAPRAPDLRYVPYGELGASPSVVVDGSPAPGTVLCLSHWPGIAGPPDLAADLSADMAFRYLATFDRHTPARLVSNNHFDQDGLVGVYALVAPEAALARRALLVEVARAGDFAVTSSTDAARLSMVLSAFADPARSPLAPLPEQYDDAVALLFDDLLGRLPELCEQLDRHRDLWGEEDATWRASVDALASGSATITEVPDLDLAVVHSSESAPADGGHRFAGRWTAGLHPLAINNATERGAVLTVRGPHYELTYRYESWVQYRSRAVRPRVDLAPLADRLGDAEAAVGGEAQWAADPVSALTPTLRPVDDVPSSLPPATVIALVETHLRSAPAAWDPFRPGH